MFIDSNDFEEIMLIGDLLNKSDDCDFNNYPVINKIRHALERCKISLIECSTTAKLWIQ